MATTHCAAAPQEGRYIVYLTPDALASAKADDNQQAMLARWEKSLAGQVHLERVLATGGWVISVISEAESPQAQLLTIEHLFGIESVERDAMLRHR